MVEESKFCNYIQEYNRIKENKNFKHKKIKIAFLRSFTCENIEPILCSKLYYINFNSEFFWSGYDPINQTLLGFTDDIYNFDPNIIIVCLRIEDVFPKIIKEYFFVENIEEEIKKICIALNNIIKSIIENTQAYILFNDFYKPVISPKGIYQNQNMRGINNIIRRINLYLSELSEKYKQLYIVNNEELFLEIGLENLIEKRFNRIFLNPYNIKYYLKLSDLYLRFIKSIYLPRKKCIILDLDNTLWEGILNENGAKGIIINKDFQRQLLYLKQSGILLAICSKNDESEVLKVINENEEMILKENDFVTRRINWKDKVENINSIVKELNIDISSCLFIDDNIFEIESVKYWLPRMDTIHFNSDFNIDNLFDNYNVEYLDISDEDKFKSDTYIRQKQILELKNEFEDNKLYLEGLNMEAKIIKLNKYNSFRIAQLVNKTNKFNLTHKRYTENELLNMSQNGYDVLALKLTDKFGDYGIVAVAIINKKNKSKNIIENFLLSCRILGRNVEFAFMNYIINKYKKNVLEGIMLLNEKNSCVSDFYKKCSFKYIGKNTWQMTSLIGKMDINYISIVN